MSFLKPWIVLALLLVSGLSWGFNTSEFSNEEDRARYKLLLEELRCLVCQNQNLADSGAGLAQDLKDIVYRQVQAGKSNDEILTFMTERYGDFVLYRPPFKSRTLLLWLGPLILMFIGVFIGITTVRRHRKTQDQQPSIAPEQRAAARQALQSDHSDDKP